MLCLRKLLLSMLVSVSLLGVVKVSAVYPEELIVEDPQFMTARDDIERFISKGKEAVGKGTYIWGGGHRNMGSDYEFPYTQLDCSGFVGGTLIHGLGVQMTAAYGAPSTYDYHKEPFNEYLRDSVDIKDAERGDIIINRQNDHMVIYLGEDEDGNHIALDSSANHSLSDDPEIGEEAPLGGVAMRKMVKEDLEIDAIFDTKRFLDEGFGVAWVDVPADKLEQELIFEYKKGGSISCDI